MTTRGFENRDVANPQIATPLSTPEKSRVVQRELKSFLRSHEQRRRQLPRALLVGLFAGLVAVAFRATLTEVEALRDRIVEYSRLHWAWCFGLPPLMGALGAAVAVGLTRRFAPEASGSGIPHVKAVLHGLRDLRWARVILVKFVGGISGIGGGLALGREGPTIQMGAAVGKMVSGWFSSTPRERRTLIAAGSGAGLAAAFNAPVSGLIFVLEEMERNFSQGVFAVTLIASAVADVTTRLLLGQLPVFHVEVASIPSLTALPVALVLGAIAGVLGVAFNRGLVWSLSSFDRLRDLPPAVIGAAVGSVVGVVALVAPGSVGGGNRLIERILAGEASSVRPHRLLRPSLRFDDGQLWLRCARGNFRSVARARLGDRSGGRRSRCRPLPSSGGASRVVCRRRHGCILFRHRSRAADGDRADRRNDRQLLAGAPPSRRVSRCLWGRRFPW